MNRTDRLYALVDELRAIAPRARTARQMAARFEVSVRTIERDLGALQQAGVPIYATPGPGGGYAVDRDHTLPPVNFSSEEATALAIALSRPRASPLADALRSAVRKVVAAMPATEAEAAQRLAGRVHLLPDVSDSPLPTSRVIEEAVVTSRVVEIDYQDRGARRQGHRSRDGDPHRARVRPRCRPGRHPHRHLQPAAGLTPHSGAPPGAAARGWAFGSVGDCPSGAEGQPAAASNA